MKIPKRIKKALKKRTKAALQMKLLNMEIDNFIRDNNIPVDPEDYLNGSGIIETPFASVERIKQAIREV